MPRFWFMLHKYDHSLDVYVNDLIDNANNVSFQVFPFNISADRKYYTMSIDGTTLWVECYPFAYGHIHNAQTLTDEKSTRRPSMLTMQKLKKFELKEYEKFKRKYKLNSTMSTLFKI